MQGPAVSDTCFLSYVLCVFRVECPRFLPTCGRDQAQILRLLGPTPLATLPALCWCSYGWTSASGIAWESWRTRLLSRRTAFWRFRPICRTAMSWISDFLPEIGGEHLLFLNLPMHALAVSFYWLRLVFKQQDIFVVKRSRNMVPLLVILSRNKNTISEIFLQRSWQYATRKHKRTFF